MKKRLFLLSFGKFIVPFIIGFGVVGTAGLFLSTELRGIYWSLISAYFFPPLGKESVIPTGIAFGIHPFFLALSIAFVDIIVALFLVWNYELAKKIPLIGKFMTKVEQIGKASSGKYGWIKPLRFIGIILFVMVPFQGSGGLVGTILGRLIGMKPWNTFIGISIGAITGCLLVAYFAEMIKSVLLQNVLMGIFIIILLLIVGMMILIYKKNQRKNNSKTL
jgi:uncharacterized membrane protein